MSQQRIERVDNIPLIHYWLTQMGVQELINQIWHPHTNWQGLSYGQLAVLFLTYILHTRSHCLSSMEEWVVTHRVRTAYQPLHRTQRGKRRPLRTATGSGG